MGGGIVDLMFHVMKFFIPFLFSLCVHEFAHGWVAKLKGDRTAEMMGRLNLNPVAHADPIGTVGLPIFALIAQLPLFGWAKPVPVNPRNLKNPRIDMFWIAFAGPLSNIALAFIGTLIYALFLVFAGKTLVAGVDWAVVSYDVLRMFIFINFILALFNLIPLHPLDGGKILARFLPPDVNQRLEEMQLYTGVLFIILILSGGFRIIAAPAIFLAQTFMGLAEMLVL